MHHTSHIIHDIAVEHVHCSEPLQQAPVEVLVVVGFEVLAVTCVCVCVCDMCVCV